jgi:5-methyltetrahydrofolate--homocysteine methyltransferase
MSQEEILDRIFNSVAKCEEPRNIVQLARKALDENIDPVKIMDAVRRGLDVVGDKYEKREYFLMELVLAGTSASEVLKLIKPVLAKSGGPQKGKVLIGTVAGDMHDIGKNLVIAMLSSAGFEVVDLGVDVSAEKFVEAVKREKPQILAMSALLTFTLDGLKNTIEALKKAGLRDSVKILVGGRPVTPAYAEQIGADGYGRDAVEAVSVANELIGK